MHKPVSALSSCSCEPYLHIVWRNLKQGSVSIVCSRSSPQIIAAQEEMLRKERELEEARKKLAQIRQQQYKFLPSELREDEGWPRPSAPCVRTNTQQRASYALLRHDYWKHSTWNRPVWWGKKQVPVLRGVFVWVCVMCVFVSEWHWHSEFNMKVVIVCSLTQLDQVIWLNLSLIYKY